MKCISNSLQLLLLTSGLLFGLAISSEERFAIAIPNPSQALPAIQLSQATAKTPLLIAQNQEKPRIAVLDFDYSSISNPSWFSYFNGGAKGVSDVLVNKLVQSGQYTLVERSRIDAILQEQNLGASGRIDASTAAQIGRILGVDAVIIGSITQFDLQQRNSGGTVGWFGIGASVTDTDAYVKLNVRIVSTTTAEILAVAEGNGNSSQSDSRVSVLGTGGGASTSNEGRLLTMATEQAVDQVTQSLNANASKLAALPKPLPTVNAVIAAVTGNQVIFNKGNTNGYRVGMQLSIERVTQTVKDPQTGKVLRQISKPIGLVELIDVDSQSSVGRVIAGSKFKVGDVGKPTR